MNGSADQGVGQIQSLPGAGGLSQTQTTLLEFLQV
jgi:hypothetical protein